MCEISGCYFLTRGTEQSQEPRADVKRREKEKTELRIRVIQLLDVLAVFWGGVLKLQLSLYSRILSSSQGQQYQHH